MTRNPGTEGQVGRHGTAVVNGPEGDDLDWLSVDWQQVEDDVGRLRQRIFTASQDGDLPKVRNLQKLMLRSRANALLSVRRVTEVNAGRKTAGIDGNVVVTAPGKAFLADRVQHRMGPWEPKPVRRVYIPKANGKRRPLGIPVIVDRALQALVVNALEPEWEARFEPRSYGFRPGRGCHDAIEAIYLVAKGKSPKRQWVLDADLAAAFDRIDHSHLLSALGGFPAKGLIEGWLKAGVVEEGRFAPTEEGTPQGGVVSPLLLNVALHGMEEAAGVRYLSTGVHAGRTVSGSPVLVRYADDLVALCVSREQAEEVKERLATWLAVRGLVFNEEKTRVVHLDDGFDFLAFNVRRYRRKLLIKPAPAALRRHRERLAAEMKALRGANASAVLKRLNPIIRGWSAYYRTVVSSQAFVKMDDYLWRLTYKWAKHGHQNKSKRWVVHRYFGMFNPSRRDRWVFGDRESGAYLLRYAWTKIVRHQMVRGRASPDDPALADYWTRRRQHGTPPLDGVSLRLLKAQDGRCPACGGLLLAADHGPQAPSDWEQWLTVTRKAVRKQAITAEREPGEPDDPVAFRLVHAWCRSRALALNDPGAGAAADP
ncbi:MAG: group II intron reverse transcriptase/maturase [Actinobacteria bacterium]|nr:group II intron reverse transcriptase/maturase [Actinomycetota bacterium]